VRRRGYRPPALSLARDVLVLVLETLTRRSSARLLQRLSRPFAVQSEGASRLPDAPAFVLALNHFSDGASGASVRAALDAVAEARPALMERVLMVGGRRDRVRTGALARVFARVGTALSAWLRRRWSAHFAVISMEGARADLGSLRAWKRVATERLSVVFPEGIAGYELGAMRAGSGRWLATIGVATVPCAVWFDGERWRVRLGAPIAWAAKATAHDAQLGLAIALLLPEFLQGEWKRDLARWRALSAPSTSATSEGL
jgi:hypothetical protein